MPIDDHVMQLLDQLDDKNRGRAEKYMNSLSNNADPEEQGRAIAYIMLLGSGQRHGVDWPCPNGAQKMHKRCR